MVMIIVRLIYSSSYMYLPIKTYFREMKKTITFQTNTGKINHFPPQNKTMSIVAVCYKKYRELHKNEQRRQ